MEKTYRIGRRFRKLKYFSAIVNCLIVFGFYFIYRFLFEGIAPQLAGAPLALLFVLLGAVTARLTLSAWDKYAASVRCVLTEDGLRVIQGRTEQLYRWEEFSGAKMQEFRFHGAFPVVFQAAGRSMMLNQHLDDLCGLTCEIFERIAPYAKLDPRLIQRAEDLRGVY